MFNCILHWDGKMYVFLTAVLYADGVDKLQFAQSFSLMDISFFLKYLFIYLHWVLVAAGRIFQSSSLWHVGSLVVA